MTGKLHRTICVVPAIWVKRLPHQGPMVRLGRRYSDVTIWWRLPWDGYRFPAWATRALAAARSRRGALRSQEIPPVESGSI